MVVSVAVVFVLPLAYTFTIVLCSLWLAGSRPQLEAGRRDGLPYGVCRVWL